MLCPVCRKKMKWNNEKHRFECPKIKVRKDKKMGCGYISDLTIKDDKFIYFQ